MQTKQNKKKSCETNTVIRSQQHTVSKTLLSGQRVTGSKP